MSAGRKPKTSGSQKRQRRHLWGIVLTDAEQAEALAKAEASGLSKSAYGRQALLGRPGVRSQRRPTVDGVLFGHAIAELNKAGSNLNQLARSFNTYGIEAAQGENFAAIAETRAALARILELTERKSPQ